MRINGNNLSGNLTFASPQFSSAQLQTDSLIQTFSREATNITSLTAMTMGGLAYRITKLAFLSRVELIRPGRMNSALQLLAPVFGLAAEVSAFQGTERILGESHLPFSEGWRNSFVDFGIMKGIGHLLRTQNLIGRHLAQDFSMVAGHKATAFLGWTPAPEGTFLNQMLHAEITNLQLGVGTHLSARLSGHRLHRLENNLENQAGAFHVRSRETSFLQKSLFSMASYGERGGRKQAARRIIQDQMGDLPSPPLPRKEVLSLRVQTPRVQTPRAQILASIEACVKPLQKEVQALEGIRLGVVELLVEESNTSSNHAKWGEIYDELMTLQTGVNREYQMALGILVPGGGGECWELKRLIKVQGSLLRAIGKSLGYRASLDHEKIPRIEVRGEGIRQMTLPELERLYSKLDIPDSVRAAIFRSIQGKQFVESFLLNGLEGLCHLLKNAAGDDKKNLLDFIERVTSPEAPDSSSFFELMIVAMNYQLAMLSRPAVMEVMARTNQFHASYPRAKGSFLAIFSKIHLMGDHDSKVIQEALNFARSRLDQDEEVLLEDHGSMPGAFVFRVKNREGKSIRYGVSAIYQEACNERVFNWIADQAYRAAFRVQRRAREEPLPIAVYLAMPCLSRQVSLPLLRSWAELCLSNAPARLEHHLSGEDYKNEMKGLILGRDYRISGRSVEVRPAGDAMPVRMMREAEKESLRRSIAEYWAQQEFQLCQMEIAYHARARDTTGKVLRREFRERHDRVPNCLEVVNFESISRGHEIERLKTKLRDEDARADDVLNLSKLLEHARCPTESVRLLRESISRYPRAKQILNEYREKFVQRLESVFSRGDRSLFEPDVADLFSSFFRGEWDSCKLETFFEWQHPRYFIEDIRADRRGSALVLRFNIHSYEGGEIGSLLMEISLPNREKTWSAHLRSFTVHAEQHQGQGVGVFTMERVFEFLRALDIGKLTLTTDGVGPYVWLRMGARFAEARQYEVFRTLFKTCLDPNYEVATSAELLARMQFMKKTNPQGFDQFIKTVPDIDYEFQLKHSKDSYQDFRRYYAARARIILPH